MTSAKQKHKTQVEDTVTTSPKDPSSQKKETSPSCEGLSRFCKGLSQRSQKICLIAGGAAVIALLLGIIVQSLKKEDVPEQEAHSHFSRQSLESSLSRLSNQGAKPTSAFTNIHNKDQHQPSGAPMAIDQATKSVGMDSSALSGSSAPLSLGLSSSNSQDASIFAKAQDKGISKTTNEQGAMTEIAQIITTLENLENKVQQLEERLFVVEKIQARAPQVWERYQRLQTAISSGEPFENELNEVKRLTGHNVKIAKAIEILETYAPSGVPNAEKLRENFKGVKAEIFNALSPSQNLSWWEKMKWYLKNGVKVSRVHEGGQENQQASPPDILHRADLDISHGHFRQAIDLLSSLKQSNRPSLKLENWLAQAMALEKIHETRHFLKNQIILEMISAQ
ncbi:MAG: hypothetical protein JNK42_03615 [Caedimonas sp.]|nr:hypothetical protein [Caedimonas sp.]